MNTVIAEEIEQTSHVPQTWGRAKFAIFLSLFVAGVGNSFVFAVLPAIGREMGLMEVQVGTIISVSATVFMLCASFWGRKSEVWGRKPIILWGLTVYSITTVLFALTIRFSLNGVIAVTVGWFMLMLFRATFSTGMSGLFPSAQAYIADITPPEERTSGMALVGMSSGIGMIAGPSVAAIFAGYGILIPFYAVAALAVVAAFAVWNFIEDVTRPEFHPDHHKERLLNRKLLPMLAVSSLMMMTLSSMQGATGFYLIDKFGLSMEGGAQKAGMVLMASAFTSVFSQMFIVHRFRLSPKQLLRFGLPVALAGVFLFMAAGTFPLMVAAMGVFGLGMGMIMPGNVAALSMSVNGHQQGRIAGLNTSAQGLGFILGPLVGAGLYQVAPLLPYGVSAGLLVTAIVLVAFFAKLPD